MTERAVQMPRARWTVWLRAVRAFSFTASLMPVLVGAMLALSAGQVRWELVPLVAVASVLFHAGTNLVSDAGDFARGVDREGTHGGSGVLTGGLLKTRSVFLGGVALLALGSGLGLVMVWIRGWVILWIGLVGLAGGFFYGGKRFGYKYVALGDVFVFALMGPLMVIGSYYVLTGGFEMRVLYASLPVGCLVAAILHANNLRDIADDRRAGVRTLANLLGLTGAKVEYFLLIGAAYAGVIVMAAAGVIGPWCLLVLLSLPPAIRNMVAIGRARPEQAGKIATIDVRTAQVHLLFGVLLSAGLGVSALL
ncbi:MAG: 1,4-dihydroxy-2-naphthoate octaprenyltransferase [Planctomycetota bacterium]